jgi:tRNA U54 and U55 pseudouridine synthase Pus10
MNAQQTLQKEIEESKTWLSREKEESTYKRNLKKRIELINWVLENMKNPDIQICNLIESKMNEIILTINKTYSIFESDKLHSELRILDWIYYQVCVNK